MRRRPLHYRLVHMSALTRSGLWIFLFISLESKRNTIISWSSHDGRDKAHGAEQNIMMGMHCGFPYSSEMESSICRQARCFKSCAVELSDILAGDMRATLPDIYLSIRHL